MSLRRFTDHRDSGTPYEIDRNHRASILGVSLFREGRLRSAAFADGPILKSGHNNRKIGAVILKGKWRGYPIYTLTLEERATCPRSCAHWLDCYGNKMNWPVRWMADGDLVGAIERDLCDLSKAHRNFAIRLHVLGDFFSVDYVQQWSAWLDRFKGLHVYGYTAWPEDTEIGLAVAKMAKDRWDRFAIRISNGPRLERSTKTTYEADASGIMDGGIVCPAQTGKTECCATCALCWQTKRRIVFLAH